MEIQARDFSTDKLQTNYYATRYSSNVRHIIRGANLETYQRSTLGPITAPIIAITPIAPPYQMKIKGIVDSSHETE